MNEIMLRFVQLHPHWLRVCKLMLSKAESWQVCDCFCLRKMHLYLFISNCTQGYLSSLEFWVQFHSFPHFNVTFSLGDNEFDVLLFIIVRDT